jgi:protein arginine kinase activator
LNLYHQTWRWACQVKKKPEFPAILPKLPEPALSLTLYPSLLEWRWQQTESVRFSSEPLAMKCQKCTKAATLHITEVVGEEQFEELHLCEDCAQKYLYEPQKASKGGGAMPSEESEEISALNQRECPFCGIKFVEFRNSGRLGCPHDYQEFREELTTLLENIHGETRHCGKTPRRMPQNKQSQELHQLRKQLQQAVTKEAYEEAARLRDQIRKLEEA